mmetsp:Transcript_38377/g.110934  ORF Transcript_38377/g.110934 Transcript_38377/m.110934 type:complete len:261 (+) Transcript_38377:1281-2063(+)
MSSREAARRPAGGRVRAAKERLGRKPPGGASCNLAAPHHRYSPNLNAHASEGGGAQYVWSSSSFCSRVLGGSVASSATSATAAGSTTSANGACAGSVSKASNALPGDSSIAVTFLTGSAGHETTVDAIASNEAASTSPDAAYASDWNSSGRDTPATASGSSGGSIGSVSRSEAVRRSSAACLFVSSVKSLRGVRGWLGDLGDIARLISLILVFPVGSPAAKSCFSSRTVLLCATVSTWERPMERSRVMLMLSCAIFLATM